MTCGGDRCSIKLLGSRANEQPTRTKWRHATKAGRPVDWRLDREMRLRRSDDSLCEHHGYSMWSPCCFLVTPKAIEQTGIGAISVAVAVCSKSRQAARCGTVTHPPAAGKGVEHAASKNRRYMLRPKNIAKCTHTGPQIRRSAPSVVRGCANQPRSVVRGARRPSLPYVRRAGYGCVFCESLALSMDKCMAMLGQAEG